MPEWVGVHLLFTMYINMGRLNVVTLDLVYSASIFFFYLGYVFVYLSISLYIHPSIYLSVYPFIYLSNNLSLYLSINLPIYFSLPPYPLCLFLTPPHPLLSLTFSLFSCIFFIFLSFCLSSLNHTSRPVLKIEANI